MTAAEASSVSLPDQRQKEAEVPKGTPPPWLRKQEQLEQLINQQQALLQAGASGLQGLLRRSSRLSMRALLDAARCKLNGGPLSCEDKQAWDDTIEAMDQAQLDKLQITKVLARLTKYGGDSVQDDGNDAAHDFTVQEIADAATQFLAPYRELFLFAYGQPPETLAFPKGCVEQQQ